MASLYEINLQTAVKHNNYWFLYRLAAEEESEELLELAENAYKNRLDWAYDEYHDSTIN